MNLHTVSLLNLRRSQLRAIGAQLNSAANVEQLSRAIENTLLSFTYVAPETSEQIYLFGIDMRRLVQERPNKEIAVPPLRSHSDPEVQLMFGGGYLGLSFADTLSSLEALKKRRREPLREQTASDIRDTSNRVDLDAT